MKRFALITCFEGGYLSGGADKMRDIRLAEVMRAMRTSRPRLYQITRHRQTVVAEFSFLRNDLIEFMRKVPKCTFKALMELNGTIFAGYFGGRK